MKGLTVAETTLAHSFMITWLSSQVLLKGTGGTAISEKIRELLLDADNHKILARTEALLYAAARSQVVGDIIVPALLEGKVVIADRYIDSTIAYQGFGRGLDRHFLQELNYIATGGLRPGLTLLLDLDPSQASDRRKGQPDRLEQEGIAFQELVREGYLQLWQEEPSRIRLLPAHLDRLKVEKMALELLINFLAKTGEEQGNSAVLLPRKETETVKPGDGEEKDEG